MRSREGWRNKSNTELVMAGAERLLQRGVALESPLGHLLECFKGRAVLSPDGGQINRPSGKASNAKAAAS